MKGRWSLQILILILITQLNSLLSQDVKNPVMQMNPVLDSLRKAGVLFGDFQAKLEISMTFSESVTFLQRWHQARNWKDTSDPLRMAIGQLLFNATNPPFDSAAARLGHFPYDSLRIPWDKFYIWEPMRIRIPVNVVEKVPIAGDSLDVQEKSDSVDDNGKQKFDSPPLPTYVYRTVIMQKDTTIMVVIDTLDEVTSPYPDFPFRYFSHPFEADSMSVAVNELLRYVEDRDSSIVYFTGIDKSVTPVWINSKTGRYARYWLKNDMLDSVTVWIGGTGRDTVGLYLEEEVTFKRPLKQAHYSDAHINVKEVDKSNLQELQKVYIKPHYWKERLEANFILNQSALSNWVKGGENSLSTSMDITEYANYENKSLHLTSNNFIRMKLGFLTTGGGPIRKNLDLIETNSKLNHKAFGKFDFSAIMLFKTQLLKGYNYPNDSVPVSKMFNPAILTIGFGLDYKPNKTTSINFSPLSYKGTFVPDTAMIDQTLYGIPRNRKALHEPGVSLMFTNEFRPVKSLSITNRLQLFTNYKHNPQNVDVDWEMIATASLNWFTDVRFNTHLIYDDDTKTQVLGDDHKPILNPDGTPRKTARAQFKEMLGISVVFRF
jgi:hypothetical protein